MAGDRAEVFRWAPHPGEEPPVSGTRGSGTVFFGRCTMRCLYCQNYPWSQEGAGRPMGTDALAGVFRSLREAGCHNWNLVSPTPWLPMIREALAAARAEGGALPVVYNTSGYERVETLAEYGADVDIYLADLRYARDETAVAASQAPGYVGVARAALLEMWRQTGRFRTGADGIAGRGTICRVLILPGHADEAVESLRWLAGAVGTGGIPVSVMAQYLPAYRAEGRQPWGRRITRREYEQVAAAVDELGFESGWMQDLEAQTPEDLIGFQMQAGSAGNGL
jgi:putative pyruvate formate lyase activating enzyme